MPTLFLQSGSARSLLSFAHDFGKIKIFFGADLWDFWDFGDFLGLRFSLSTSKVQSAVTLQIGHTQAYYLRSIPVKYERQKSFQLRIEDCESQIFLSATPGSRTDRQQKN